MFNGGYMSYISIILFILGGISFTSFTYNELNTNPGSKKFHKEYPIPWTLVAFILWWLWVGLAIGYIIFYVIFNIKKCLPTNDAADEAKYDL